MSAVGYKYGKWWGGGGVARSDDGPCGGKEREREDNILKEPAPSVDGLPVSVGSVLLVHVRALDGTCR